MYKQVTGYILLVVYLSVSPVGIAGEEIDTRKKLYLNQAERHHVLSEMRLFLNSVQKITRGVAEEDMKLVVEYARKAGRAAGGGAPAGFRDKLPKEFRMLGHQTHAKFDQLALDAADLGDASHVLSQLSSLMKNCIACHASYQIKVSEAQ